MTPEQILAMCDELATEVTDDEIRKEFRRLFMLLAMSIGVLVENSKKEGATC